MREKILIVEDEPDIIKMLEYNLKKEGFRITSVSDGREALRRSEREHPDIFEIGNLTIDFSKIKVTVGNKPVELTSKEFELLSALVKAKGRVLSRDYLLDNIWGFDNAIEIQSRTVDVHIQTLRKKLKQAAKRVVTVKNYGYRFEQEEE